MDFLKTYSKEKADMILEPMQVMIQLAILSYEPIGTKIHVSNNILKLQNEILELKDIIHKLTSSETFKDFKKNL